MPKSAVDGAGAADADKLKPAAGKVTDEACLPKSGEVDVEEVSHDGLVFLDQIGPTAYQLTHMITLETVTFDDDKGWVLFLNDDSGQAVVHTAGGEEEEEEGGEVVVIGERDRGFGAYCGVCMMTTIWRGKSRGRGI